jgi:hypothetical protein
MAKLQPKGKHREGPDTFQVGPAFFTKPVQNFQILILAFGRSIGEAMFLTKA